MSNGDIYNMESQISLIKSIVSSYFGDDFLDKKRKNNTINPKQLFAYLLSIFTELSCRDISRVTGFQSGSNVIFVIREVNNKCLKNDQLKRMVIALESVVEYSMKQGRIFDPATDPTHYCCVFGCKNVLTRQERLYSNRCLMHQEQQTLFSLIDKYVDKAYSNTKPITSKKQKKRVA